MSQPILVFDSGIGGLSVLAEIRKRLPHHDYCYVFDNARLPYGELEEQELVSGCVALISQLVERTHACIVVVACNTASTVVLPALRAKLHIPVVGVVPAIKPAALLSKSKRIGLLATPGTVKRHYTHELISQFADDCHVELFGCSELVMMAEHKIATGQLGIARLTQILSPVVDANLDVLVLGCTHFPMLRDELQQVLGLGVTLLDSGAAIAKRVDTLLAHGKNISHNSEYERNGSLMRAFYTKAEITEGLATTLADCGFSTLERITTINSNSD
ncbi:glutamate racemase [Shewanella oneidensis MR-1]|uniref:Glutamate racemase n=1 Tax=Shewanella oneidensis (strain ATCC 700550 / JCM 31522 / CIP 106686 / LMG 19005 / NCIMB 14063 / MR-1) TaxID=211586 RepID=MURI_SHEON|nr:glutamate racemase [Shewanella oneidensis]Q8EK90.1 RecName: Full=Glutamate racemase [Shewanella oneidensis MR-1]AAN53293.1 glutamate racemase MurI [Shewanella oneidensis MR-1]MDX5997826.1 glutamate racemase [Shewanella oneidensis]QKG95162.1 glutamate racemase [Shewanella oneidensis MR-1]